MMKSLPRGFGAVSPPCFLFVSSSWIDIIRVISWAASILYSCFHDGDSSLPGHDVFGLSVLWTRHLRNARVECPQIWNKHQLGLKDELISLWWSKVRSQGYCDLTFCEPNLSGITSGNFITSGTIFYLDSRMIHIFKVHYIYIKWVWTSMDVNCNLTSW